MNVYREVAEKLCGQDFPLLEEAILTVCKFPHSLSTLKISHVNGYTSSWLKADFAETSRVIWLLVVMQGGMVSLWQN